MAEVLNRSLQASSLPLGAHISCTTTHGDVLRGNVIATDETNEAVVIKSVNSSTSTPSQSTTSSLSSGDVHIINLRHVSDLSITPQPQQNGVTTDPSALPRINLAKVDQRIKKNLADRRREINSRGVNVSEEAQQLFDSLRKVPKPYIDTLKMTELVDSTSGIVYNDISWNKDVIVIMNDVHVPPPYTPDSCTGSPQLTSLIKKQVTKFNEAKSKAGEDPA